MTENKAGLERMGGALRRRSRSWPHGHSRCRGGVAGDMRRECREGRQKRNLRSPPTSSVPRCIPPWRCATPRIEAPGHGPRQGGRWYAAVGRREDSVGWGRGILSQKNWGLWFYCGSVTGQACGGEQRDGGVFVRATDRDAGRTLEVSGRVGGGVGEVDWAGIGGSTALGGSPGANFKKANLAKGRGPPL